MLSPRRHAASAARRPRRAAFSLVELLLVIVLLGIVAGGMLGVIAKQQRFYTGASGVLAARGTVRQGLGALQSELRALSPSSGDIYQMGATYIEYRAPVAASVVCTIDPTREIITIPPATLSQRNGLTSWASKPQVGDTLLIYDPGTQPGMIDDKWAPYQLSAAPVGAATCPVSTTLTATSAEAANGWTLTTATPLSGTIGVGSSIRVFRRARYELYQETNGNWYLGYRECPSTCSSLTPVAGPFRSGTDASRPGLQLAYYDSTGAVTTNPKLVRRIDIVVRANSASGYGMQGRVTKQYQDSLAATIAVRN